MVAETDDRLTGFVTATPSNEDGFDSYIEHLHVRPDLTGAGIGRILLAEAVDRLIVIGCRSAYLLVLAGNRRAIRFYERLGGETTPLGLADFGGIRCPHVRIAWIDLAGLADACRDRR